VPAPTPTPEPTPAPTPDPALGPNGERALQAERDARKEAEKQARAEKARADALEREKLSETDKLKADAERGRELAEQATAKLRAANLTVALGAAGLVGPRAKAAARLLDGVEYDDADEPTNLIDRLAAAKAAYGEELFQGATPTPAPNSEPTPHPAHPSLHQGASAKPADPKEDEKFAAYMRQNFPGAMPAPTT
jgi:hypothetical protein